MRLFLLLFGLIHLVSCKEETQTYTLSDEALVSLVIDLHMGEEAIAKVGDAFRDSMSAEIKKSIAAIHHISPEEMEFNIDLLQRNPDKGAEIYRIVVDRLDSLKIQLIRDQKETLTKKPKPRR